MDRTSIEVKRYKHEPKLMSKARAKRAQEMMIVRLQKKTILLVAFLAFIALFTLSIEAVLAVPKMKKPKLERTPFMIKWNFDLRSAYPGEQVITENGILYIKDAIVEGSVEADPSSPISGAVWTILSGTWDSNTFAGTFNGKWTIATDNGTFEGSVVGSVSLIYISGRFVGQGTNDFRGQKIMGSFEGTVSNYNVNLTLKGELTTK